MTGFVSLSYRNTCPSASCSCPGCPTRAPWVGWDGSLPRGARPSDVDIVLDNHGALLVGEFKPYVRPGADPRVVRSRLLDSRGQALLLESLAERPRTHVYLLSHEEHGAPTSTWMRLVLRPTGGVDVDVPVTLSHAEANERVRAWLLTDGSTPPVV